MSLEDRPDDVLCARLKRRGKWRRESIASDVVSESPQPGSRQLPRPWCFACDRAADDGRSVLVVLSALRSISEFLELAGPLDRERPQVRHRATIAVCGFDHGFSFIVGGHRSISRVGTHDVRRDRETQVFENPYRFIETARLWLVMPALVRQVDHELGAASLHKFEFTCCEHVLSSREHGMSDLESVLELWSHNQLTLDGHEGLPRGEVTSDLWCRRAPLEGCSPCPSPIRRSSAMTLFRSR